MPNHAIVIGINDYPGINNLHGPCNDAQLFLKWVTHPGPGNVGPEHVHKLLSTDFEPATNVTDAKPVSDQIAEKFEEVLQGNPIQHVGDRLYVFVAGHGMSDVNRPESAAIIAANGSTKSINLAHIVVTDYVNYFRRIYAFKEIILIMDCCLDATARRPLDMKGFMQGDPHLNSGQVKMFLAKATVWSKKSYEKEFNGVTRGIFSVAIMEALEKAPGEGDKVTGLAIRNYIDQHFKTIAGDKTLQDPTIEGKGHEKIIFYERQAVNAHEAAMAFTLIVKINGAADDEIVDLLEGSFLLDSKVVTDGAAKFQVAAGFYKVNVQGTDRYALIEVVKDHEETL